MKPAPCPKCLKPMVRRKRNKPPNMAKRHYFTEWDFCPGCGSVKHYEEFKRASKDYQGEYGEQTMNSIEPYKKELMRLQTTILEKFPEHPLFDSAMGLIANVTAENIESRIPELASILVEMEKTNEIYCIECGQQMLKRTNNGKCGQCNNGPTDIRQTFIVISGTLEEASKFAKEISKKLDEGYFCKDPIKQKEDILYQFMQLKTEARAK